MKCFKHIPFQRKYYQLFFLGNYFKRFQEEIIHNTTSICESLKYLYTKNHITVNKESDVSNPYMLKSVQNLEVPTHTKEYINILETFFLQR